MKNIKMPLMAPQLLQDKAPNPNLAFEALHSLVPTAPSSLTSLYGPCGPASTWPSLGVWVRALCLLSSASVLLPGQVPPLSPGWAQPPYLLPLPVVLYMVARVIITTSDHFLSCPLLSHMQ